MSTAPWCTPSTVFSRPPCSAASTTRTYPRRCSTRRNRAARWACLATNSSTPTGSAASVATLAFRPPPARDGTACPTATPARTPCRRSCGVGVAVAVTEGATSPSPTTVSGRGQRAPAVPMPGVGRTTCRRFPDSGLARGTRPTCLPSTAPRRRTRTSSSSTTTAAPTYCSAVSTSRSSLRSWCRPPAASSSRPITSGRPRRSGGAARLSIPMSTTPKTTTRPSPSPGMFSRRPATRGKGIRSSASATGRRTSSSPATRRGAT
mmetsp:Transcript_49861/g.160623  ORF Transcript_49861/g.160623 Transcript_49861/m.160623 type:complete len:263 (-) Transcript_49861:1311-2099(-)